MVNWINTITSQFRKLDKTATDNLSEFEKFVMDHRFPMYDFTNGFETDADTESRIVDLMNPKQKPIHSKSDGVVFDPSEEEQPAFFLKNSRRSFIVATDSHDYLMAAITTSIEQATLFENLEVTDGATYKTRFAHRSSGTESGKFFQYGLLLKFHDLFSAEKEIILSSTCLEILRRFTSPDDLELFNKLCRRRIISLLIAQDPDRQKNTIVVFCQHAGCKYADGFLYNKRPAISSDFHRIGSNCPDGHGFCLRCLNFDHLGFCADTRQEREELAAMPGQKMCPTCRTIIFKNGGCNHMHCTSCDQNFCWTCSAKFSSSEQYRQHGTCSQFD
jgi:hypothetical protein